LSERRQAGGLLVESIVFVPWRRRTPAIFDAALCDQREEGIGEEESRRQLSPACRQLGCHVAWALSMGCSSGVRRVEDISFLRLRWPVKATVALNIKISDRLKRSREITYYGSFGS